MRNRSVAEAQQTSPDVPEKGQVLEEDWLGQLPDHILVDIISRLNLKDAVRTSVLSTRWKYLWTFTTSLNFDASFLLSEVREDATDDERSKYINWVNKVLELHRGSNTYEFIINFDLNDSYESYITEWIYTAISKGVQKFELVFCYGNHDMYFFPEKFCNRPRNQCGVSGLESLRSLRLDGVHVTGEMLEFFIHNCPLDQLCVGHSLELLRLQVVGSSVQLKHLDIWDCYLLEELEISAPSLLSLKFKGDGIEKLHVENVPNLVDLSIDGVDMSKAGSSVDPFVSYFHQLKNLVLGYYLDGVYIDFSQLELPKLRHLTLCVCLLKHEILLHMTGIVKACPLLEKLTLALYGSFFPTRREMSQIPKYPLQHLKVVELCLFGGNACLLGLASYFLENASMLEKVIVRSPSEIDCLEMLGSELPQGVQLLVL